MKLDEKQISREVIFKGKVFNVYKDKITLPDETESFRELVEHRGGVCIAAKNENNEYLMVSQYRYPIKQIFFEFVAGKKEQGEDPLKTAERELIEETGYQAKNFSYMGSFVPTCGYSSEIIDMYYADDLTFIGQNLDENEFLNVSSIKLDDLITMIMNDELKDAKTIILALKLKNLGK